MQLADGLGWKVKNEEMGQLAALSQSREASRLSIQRTPNRFPPPRYRELAQHRSHQFLLEGKAAEGITVSSEPEREGTRLLGDKAEPRTPDGNGRCRMKPPGAFSPRTKMPVSHAVSLHDRICLLSENFCRTLRRGGVYRVERVRRFPFQALSGRLTTMIARDPRIKPGRIS